MEAKLRARTARVGETVILRRKSEALLGFLSRFPAGGKVQAL
jgi:hypothetical protein